MTMTPSNDNTPDTQEEMNFYFWLGAGDETGSFVTEAEFNQRQTEDRKNLDDFLNCRTTK